VIDELDPVVGMKAEDAKGKLPQLRFQHRNQPRFPDLRRRSHHLPLRHLVHRVDVAHPFHPLQIALMNAVYPQVSGPTIRARFPPLANGHLHRPGLLIPDSPLPVSRALPQIVNMRHRNRRQPLVARIPVFVILAIQNLLRGWPAQRFVRFIYCPQQLQVSRGVTSCEPVPLIAPLLHLPLFLVAGDQPGHLPPGSVPSSWRGTVVADPWLHASASNTAADTTSASPIRRPPRAQSPPNAPPGSLARMPGSAPGSIPLCSPR